MRKVVVEGIEITFNDLTKEKQCELYLKNKKKYKEDASKSINSWIRQMVVRDETESSEFLNQMLRYEIKNGNNKDVEEEIFNNKIFEIDEETTKIYAASKDWETRKKAAQFSKKSEILKQMLKDEINGDNNEEVKYAIFHNIALEIDEEIFNIYSLAKNWEKCRNAARVSTDSEFLNQLLRDVVKAKNRYEGIIINTWYVIIDNDNFEMDEETANILASSKEPIERCEAAKLSTNSKFLNEMYCNELKGKNDELVKDEIRFNENFKIEEDTIKISALSKNWRDRHYAARMTTDSKLLNQMLRYEIKHKNVKSVKSAILDNEIFEIDEKTIEFYQKQVSKGNNKDSLLEDYLAKH